MIKWLLPAFLILLVVGCGKPDASGQAPDTRSEESPAQRGASEDFPIDEKRPKVEDPLAKPVSPAPSTTNDSQAGILYSDSFSDVTGSIARITNGMRVNQGPVSTRVVMPFQGLPEEGQLLLQIVEDASTVGPDEKPGVLALSWQEIPPLLKYSGFVYQGTATERIVLPSLASAKSPTELMGLRLKFRYRGNNDQGQMPLKFKIHCRLEPNLPDSYKKRLDFGNLTPTDVWQDFDMALWEGTNAEAFLQSIAQESPQTFKVVWGQVGPLANYQPGDTLLIDDVAIVEAEESPQN